MKAAPVPEESACQRRIECAAKCCVMTFACLCLFFTLGALPAFFLWRRFLVEGDPPPKFMDVDIEPLSRSVNSEVIAGPIQGMYHIPKVIHQICFKSRPDYADMATGYWKSLNPDYTYIYWDTPLTSNFLTKFYPQINAVKDHFSVVELSDVLRYAALYTYGGMYFDLDTVPRISIDAWPEIFDMDPHAGGFVVKTVFIQPQDGPEFGTWESWKHWIWKKQRAKRFYNAYQWGFGFEPGHPAMARALALCLSHANWKYNFPTKEQDPNWWSRRNKWQSFTLGKTGPVVFQNALAWFAANEGKIPGSNPGPITRLPVKTFLDGTTVWPKNPKKSVVKHLDKRFWASEFTDGQPIEKKRRRRIPDAPDSGDPGGDGLRTGGLPPSPFDERSALSVAGVFEP